VQAEDYDTQNACKKCNGLYVDCASTRSLPLIEKAVLMVINDLLEGAA